MLKEVERVVFTTSEAEGVVFSGYSKAEAGQVFTKWLKENLAWVEAGLDDVKVIEILDVELGVVEFNNSVLITYLCDECANDDCESNGEAHEVEIQKCRFTEQKIVSL